MNKILSIASVAVFFALFNVSHVEASGKAPEQLIKESKASIKEVSVADAKKMLDQKENIILLDVRDKHEFEE
jgi:hypothetical protein